MKKLIVLPGLVIAAAMLVALTAAGPGDDPGDRPGSGPPDSMGSVNPKDPVKAGPGQAPEAEAEPAQTEETQAENAGPEYVGALKCKVCHLDIYKAWETTRHASAISTLESKDLEDPGCLVCHTTGLGSGGYGAETGLTNLAGVQCEACHGAGSLYSRSSVMRERELSVEMGLVLVDSTTCVTCHNSESPTFKGFAYQAGLSTGTHSRKRNKPD